MESSRFDDYQILGQHPSELEQVHVQTPFPEEPYYEYWEIPSKMRDFGLLFRTWKSGSNNLGGLPPLNTHPCVSFLALDRRQVTDRRGVRTPQRLPERGVGPDASPHRGAGTETPQDQDGRRPISWVLEKG